MCGLTKRVQSLQQIMEILEERARLVDQRRLYEAALYEVALSGNVSEFESLMEKDQLILDRARVTTSFHETPLHIAAMRGHLDLTKALLKRSPNLATALDSFGRCPLHWASVNGHTDIVRELLQVNSGVCGLGDEDGTTPLHLAAVEGRVEVIRELVRCRPESARKTLGSSGETVLHLCVKHNRLEVLKLLMEESVISEDEFVNHRDNRGNTILHLAAALKKTVEYLVQIEAVKGQANVKNRDGFTALDILEHNPIMDCKSEVRMLLLQAAASELKPQTGCCSWESVVKRLRWIWNKHFKTDGKWIEDARGNLIMAATITATVAFQAGLSPPGSVWQSEDDFRNSTSVAGIEYGPGFGAGNSILATLMPRDFTKFLTYYTISFISSVCIILMMISGFPVNNKFCTWALTSATCLTFTFMVLTYLESLVMLTPINETYYHVLPIYRRSFYTVLSLFGLTLLIHLTHASVWTVGKLSPSRLVNLFGSWWKTGADRELLVSHKPLRTDENEPPPHHQTV